MVNHTYDRSLTEGFLDLTAIVKNLHDIANYWAGQKCSFGFFSKLLCKNLNKILANPRLVVKPKRFCETDYFLRN